jgi:hypothetical protein
MPEITLCLDPSGNFAEGKGNTGYAVFVDGELENFGSISAGDYPSAEFYWKQVGLLITPQTTRVVCESYKLQPSKSRAQSYSSLETPQLIGYLRMRAVGFWVKWVFQDPKDKIRVADEQLVHLGVLEKRGNRHYCLGKPTNDHMRDAVRHGIFYFRYRHGKGA